MNKPSTSRAQSPSTPNAFEINRRVMASDLTPAAKNILIVILDHARYGASRCTATTRTLARESGVTERTIRNALPDLAGRGLIRIDRATGSPCSRHTIHVGPCIHQVGNPFPLRVHEGGNDFHEGGNLGVHEGGNRCRQKREEKTGERVGFSPPPEDTELIPNQWTAKCFGHLPDVRRFLDGLTSHAPENLSPDGP